MISSPRRGPRITVAGALLLALAACGGAPSAPPDQSAGAPSAAETDRTPEFCNTLVQIESVFASSPPLEVLPPDQVQGVIDQQLAALEPLFATAQETAPDDVAGDVDRLVETTRTGLTTGDFSGTEDPAFAASEDAVDEKALAACGFEETSVTATDFEYQGMPDSLAAGESAVTLTNEGNQIHEIAIARINDDVTMPVEELLSLPMEEALASVQLVGIVFAAPGETDTSFIDAQPGRYVATCFIPDGTTLTAEGTGPPHFVLGMLKEFTVA